MFASLHPKKLRCSIGMMIVISCTKPKITVLYTIDHNASPQISQTASTTYNIVFNVDFLSKLQLELYLHARKLMMFAIWHKEVAILHIYFFLDPSQQVAHVTLISPCEVDVSSLNISFDQNRAGEQAQQK